MGKPSYTKLPGSDPDESSAGPSSSSAGAGAVPPTTSVPPLIDLSADNSSPTPEELPPYTLTDPSESVTADPNNNDNNGGLPPYSYNPDIDPPPFSEYIPESYQHYWYDYLVTHDPHLNTDGEALYRFLIEQNKLPPRQYVKISGSHNETRNVQERDKDGHWRTRTETHSVTDFMFRLDLSAGLESVVRFVAGMGGSQRVLEAIAIEGGGVRSAYWNRGVCEGVLKVVGDDVKTYRGGVCKRQYRAPRMGKMRAAAKGKCRWCCRRKCRRRQQQQDEEAARLFLDTPEISADGAPGSSSSVPAGPTNSSSANDIKPDSLLTIREWADRYCDLNTSFKEFIVHKQIDNLSESLLTELLTNVVRATNYRGSISITFPRTHHKIAIYPNTRLARWRQNQWIRWFFYLTFLWIITWPILWMLTKKFHVVVSEWTWGFMYEEESDQAAFQQGQTTGTSLAQQTDGGAPRMRVMRDGRCEREWVRLWETTIRWATRRRMMNDKTVLCAEDRRQAMAEEEERRRRMLLGRGALMPQTGLQVVDRALTVVGQLIGDVTGGMGANQYGDSPWGGDGMW